MQKPFRAFLILLLSNQILAQDPKSSPVLEAQPPHQTKIEIIEPGRAAEGKDALISRVEQYWNGYTASNWLELYDMHLPGFKEVMTLTTFASKKRSRMDAFQIDHISFWGDQCAFVRLRTEMTAESMPLKGFPIRQYWVLIDGEWFLYENPYTSVMEVFAKRPGQNLEKPCILPSLAAEVGEESPKVTKQKASKM